MYTMANLTSDQLNKINELEQKTGKTLLAFGAQSFKPAEVEALELDQIMALEKELNLSLVAVTQ